MKGIVLDVFAPIAAGLCPAAPSSKLLQMQNRNVSRPAPGSPRPAPQGLVQTRVGGNVSDIELVVVTTKQLRQRLVNELGASGLSLHECLDSIDSRMSEKEMRGLRFIASVRNKLINEVNVNTLDNRANFVSAVDQANATITARAAEKRVRGTPLDFNISRVNSASRKSGSGCFIATAVYPDPDSPQLTYLRRYRDESLRNTAVGRFGVALYYRLSPPVANWLTRHPGCAALVRRALNAVVHRLERD